MDAYKISLNGKWFILAEDEFVFADNIADGDLVLGNFNLKSRIDRIYNKVRYGELVIHKLEIKNVGHIKKGCLV